MIKKEPRAINYWRLLAIIFGILTIGAISETKRILTSHAPDIATNRSSLIPMALFMTGLILFLTVYFWRKGK